MRKYLNLFMIMYLILLLFVFVNFLLRLFGYAFTPLLWNPWLYLGAGTAFAHIWHRFYRKHAPNWKNLISVLLSLFAMVILVFFIELFFTFFFITKGFTSSWYTSKISKRKPLSKTMVFSFNEYSE